MIGGSPISFPAQGFLPSSVPGNQAAPPYAVGPPSQPYPGSVLPGMTAAPSPRPIARGVSEDDPPRRRTLPESPGLPPRRSFPATPVTLPPPEQLGIGTPGPAAAGDLDWNVVHARLRQLGSLTCQLQKLPEGRFRFSCLLPTTLPDQPRRFEACAATEREAVQSVLVQAEQWAAPGR